MTAAPRRWSVALAVAMAAISSAAPLSAQVRTAPAATSQPLAVRAFGDFGAIRFAAANTFDAVLGSPTGVLFSGGGEIVLPQGLFATIRVSRFHKTGERVLVSSGEVFRLGIENTVSVTPVELTGGFRFRDSSSMIPYLGGGVGWHKYSETSQFADDTENVDETFTGYHLLGGVEFRVHRWFGVGGEAQWTTVPDALDATANSASAAFDETDLGGITFRVKFVVGR